MALYNRMNYKLVKQKGCTVLKIIISLELKEIDTVYKIKRGFWILKFLLLDSQISTGKGLANKTTQLQTQATFY